MFALNRKGTVIAEGLRSVGSVSADGAVEVNGQVDGDLHRTSLTVSPKAFIHGGINAHRVVVNGKVEGLSFPKIISGRIGGAVQPGSEWRR